jgi:hypothetical protein
MSLERNPNLVNDATPIVAPGQEPQGVAFSSKYAYYASQPAGMLAGEVNAASLRRPSGHCSGPGVD